MKVNVDNCHKNNKRLTFSLLVNNLLQQTAQLEKHLNSAPGMEWLSIIVIRNGRSHPSEEQIQQGLVLAARSDIQKGIKTV
jgi:hypothetical protein